MVGVSQKVHAMCMVNFYVGNYTIWHMDLSFSMSLARARDVIRIKTGTFFSVDNVSYESLGEKNLVHIFVSVGLKLGQREVHVL